jgi:hypothetical protein
MGGVKGVWGECGWYGESGSGMGRVLVVWRECG